MRTFLLTWNPDGPGRSSLVGLTGVHRWGVGIRKSGIAEGDRAYLFRQRHERGLVASGWFDSEIYPGEHFDGSGRITTYADIRFDLVLPVADRLDVTLLKSRVPTVAWDHLQGSGVEVKAPDLLDELWSAHVSDM